jgi:hypothetical protein
MVAEQVAEAMYLMVHRKQREKKNQGTRCNFERHNPSDNSS